MTSPELLQQIEEFSGCTFPVNRMFVEFCESSGLNPADPVARYVFFSAAMAMYNVIMVTTRDGTLTQIRDLTANVKNDLDAYFVNRTTPIQ